MNELPDYLQNLYPFESHYMPMDDGNRLHYVDVGAGETILFLHGNPTWSFFYRDLIKILRDDFRCVALDHMGFGLSDKPQNYDYSLQSHINNAVKFAEKMKFGKFHLVMHDFGAVVGLALGTRWPERISSITMLNSAAFLHPKLPWNVLLFKIPLIGTILNRVLNLFTKMYAASSFDETTNPSVRDGYLFPYGSFFDRVAINEAAYNVPWFADHATNDVYLELEKKLFILFSKKIKFFWADHDLIWTPPLLKLWAKIYPNAILKRYELAGNYIFENNTEAIKDVRNFIMSARNLERFTTNNPLVK